ncbi:hypothetical protein H5410_032159 [Solanum commersonii]|uniref:Uncharacterized protein n=1 Tax=Solanum commersonii TaxID=4109 RepID=A0A9J5YLC2_SOLCO|nr:hypothetical protein H5410_032159 [Solanum commersonii]
MPLLVSNPPPPRSKKNIQSTIRKKGRFHNIKNQVCKIFVKTCQKSEHTSRKSPRLVEASSTVGIEPPTFNILTQTPPHNKNATPAKKVGTSQNKKQNTGKKKKTQAKADYRK